MSITPTPTNPRTPRRHRTARLAAAAVSLLSLGVSASPALADNCPNAALRAQSNSTQLPHCRAYETVTPAYMEGFGFLLTRQNFTDDGNTISFLSTGNFADNTNGGSAGNQYVATRASTGWMTQSVDPPPDLYELSFGVGADVLSPDLRRSVWTMRLRPDGTHTQYLREPDGTFALVGQGSGLPAIVGASVDLSHLVFNHAPGAGSVANAALWEFVGTGNTGPPRAVSVTNDGELIPSEACFRKLSADGRVIVFASECDLGAGPPQPLWARVGGSATVAVSGSECTRGPGDPGGVCNALASAAYAGAADDGSRVFFTTSQQLVNADTDATDDLYACDIPAGSPAPVGAANSCDSLTRVSGVNGARVESVAKVSDDGSRAYFVAQGVLADNLGTNGAQPASGDHNLYLWTKNAEHPDGQTYFVASMGTSDLSDLRTQMTPDSRYLVFETASQLVTADTDDAVDLYRYDAQTAALARLSTTASGAGGNGAFDASISHVPVRSGTNGYLRSQWASTSDGSMVVFETAEALSLADTNGESDVYLWHDGRVWWISGGVDGGRSPLITPSGRDIFFATNQAPSNDFYGDLYDARVGGGFDLRQPVPCSGDGCQGQQSAAPVLASPGGGGPGRGDVDEGIRPAIGGIANLSAADRAVLARGGKARLKLRVNRSGKVTLAAKARLEGKSRRVALASARAKRAGRVSIPFGLSRSARAALARRGSLTIGLTVRLQDARPKTLTVTLRAKSGKGGSR